MTPQEKNKLGMAFTPAIFMLSGLFALAAFGVYLHRNH